MMKKQAIAGWLLALALLAPASARAGVISYNSTTTPAVVNIGPTLTDLVNVVWAFPEFNPALFGGASLQSVSIQISGSVATNFGIENIGDSNITDGGVRAEVIVDVQDIGNNLTSSVMTLLTNQFVFADMTTTSPNTGTPPGTPGGIPAILPDGIVNGVAADADVVSNLYTAPLILAIFTGAGNENLLVDSFTSTLLTFTGGNAEVSQQTFLSLNGQITYTYENFEEPAAVPEPSSMFLLGSGILALGYSLKRRKQS